MPTAPSTSVSPYRVTNERPNGNFELHSWLCAEKRQPVALAERRLSAIGSYLTDFLLAFQVLQRPKSADSRPRFSQRICAALLP